MLSHVVGELHCLPNWSSILRSRRVTHRGVGLSCSNGCPDAPPPDPEFVIHKLSRQSKQVTVMAAPKQVYIGIIGSLIFIYMKTHQS